LFLPAYLISQSVSVFPKKELYCTDDTITIVSDKKGSSYIWNVSSYSGPVLFPDSLKVLYPKAARFGSETISDSLVFINKVPGVVKFYVTIDTDSIILLSKFTLKWIQQVPAWCSVCANANSYNLNECSYVAINPPYIDYKGDTLFSDVLNTSYLTALKSNQYYTFKTLYTCYNDTLSFHVYIDSVPKTDRDTSIAVCLTNDAFSLNTLLSKSALTDGIWKNEAKQEVDTLFLPLKTEGGNFTYSKSFPTRYKTLAYPPVISYCSSLANYYIQVNDCGVSKVAISVYLYGRFEVLPGTHVSLENKESHVLYEMLSDSFGMSRFTIPYGSYLLRLFTRDSVFTAYDVEVYQASKNLIVFVYNNLMVSNTEQIKVYPNPAIDFLIIDSEIEKSFDYAIFDLQGRQVRYGSSVSNTIVDLKELACGMYTLKILIDDQILIKVIWKNNE